VTQWEPPSDYDSQEEVEEEEGGAEEEEEEEEEDGDGGTDSDAMPAVIRDPEDELLHSMRPGASHGRRPLHVGSPTGADAAAASASAGGGQSSDESAASPGANFSVIQLEDGVGFEGLQPSVWAALSDSGGGGDRAPAEVLSFDMGDEAQLAGSSASDEDDDSDASSEPEWVEYTDEATGRPYYFNTISGTTQWTLPEGSADDDTDEAEQRQQQQQQQQATGQEAGLPLAVGSAVDHGEV
jgi:hypothetical protein